MSTTIVQYSPDESCVRWFKEGVPFFYDLATCMGRGLTTLNRIRKFLEIWYGVIAPSRNIILALLKETGGKMVGTAVNTYGHVSNVCLIHMETFSERVRQALEGKEIKTIPPLLKESLSETVQ